MTTPTTRDAAEALAAVAAAASSQNLSPSQAAQAAREAANSWKNQDAENVDAPIRFVSLEKVKEEIQEESPLLNQLKEGKNNSLLEFMLLLQNFRLQESPETDHTVEAAQKVIQTARILEAAYQGLLDLLPPDSSNPKLIRDLLPPCIGKKGDATQTFFEACKESVAATEIEPREENIAREEKITQTKESERDEAESKNMTSKSMFNVFRRKSNSLLRKKKKEDYGNEESAPLQLPPCRPLLPGEYNVVIEKDMLGLTVENVLERTIVRTVLPGGPAKKAGARVGSLIVQVGNVDTRNLTHFETIDELRQSQRPLQLILRQVSDGALRSAREEMGRLIRGAGFGNITEENAEAAGRPLVGNDMRIESYTRLVRRLMASPSKLKKDEDLVKPCEKLVWILTLYLVGMETEAYKIGNGQITPGNIPGSPSHCKKDYEDAAQSVARVLLDFATKRINSSAAKQKSKKKENKKNFAAPPPPPPHVSGRNRGRPSSKPGLMGSSSMIHDKPLLQIGDVLQRVRGFLADTSAPPAALVRGEVISFLCDVLDADTEMEMAAEENESAASGTNVASTDDLGSAGSLLKLIVLNCPGMKSPGCEQLSGDPRIDSDLQKELKQRFGSSDSFSHKDLHSLHAGNRFLAIVHRLAASKSTSARKTACSLGPVLWGHLDFPHQLQLRGVITRALHDVDIIVRKTTATVLHELAELVFDSRCVPWLVLMCERAMTDPEPQLRSAAMTLTWHLAEHLPNAFGGDASKGSRYLQRLPSRDDPIFADVYLLQCKLLPVSTRLAEDRSPSVRVAVAAQCDRLCDSLGDHWSSVVIDVLLALLSDSDERVRCEAVLCVPRLARVVLISKVPGTISSSEISVLEALIPASLRLHKDGSGSVRVSLAEAAGSLLTLMVDVQHQVMFPRSPTEDPVRNDGDNGKNYKAIVDEKLIPLVQALLNDKDPEVTSAALRALTNTSRPRKANRGKLLSVASDDEIFTLIVSVTDKCPRR